MGKKRETKPIEPIIFMNTPIEDASKDAIGIQASVNAVEQAINEGAKMIGVIAEYGAGKSSLTELLIKRSKPKVIRVNLWDTLSEVATSETKTINYLTKSFVYQLAMGKSPYRAEHVNKILSNNYGIISFSTGLIRTWICVLLAGLLEGLYLVCDGITSKTLQKLFGIVNGAWAYVLNDFAPIFQLLAIGFIAIALLDANIAYSHWKNESKRVTDIGEVFSAYSYVHRCLRTWFSPRLVVIEDLDRIEEPQKIVEFLKELYRFHNLCHSKYRKDPVFLISIAPETQLKDKKEEWSGELSNIYSKIFDFTVSLKPIHYDDYRTVLQDILDSEREKKERLNAILKDQEKLMDGKVSAAFAWLYKGDNLTLRQIKDRLNDAIELYVELLNKNYGGDPAISFRTCVCVTYLEKVYGKDYYELIKNETVLSNILQASYQWRNNRHITKREDYEEEVYKLYNKSEISKDLAELIFLRILDTDYRMYFYSFPKGSYIKNADEKDICNYIEYPNDYEYEYMELNEKMQRLVMSRRLDMVKESIVRIANSQITRKYPQVVYENYHLFQMAYNEDEDLCLLSLDANMVWESVVPKENVRLLKNVKGFLEEPDMGISKETKVSFWQQFCVSLRKSEEDSKEEVFLAIRETLIEIFQNEILYFKELFVSAEVGVELPFISETEIAKINNLELSLELIDEREINLKTFEVISGLFEEPLPIELQNRARLLHEELYEQERLSDVAEYLCHFMRVNKLVINSFLLGLSKLVKDKTFSSEEFIECLNAFKVEDLSDEQLVQINALDLDGKLKEEIIDCLIRKKLYSLPLRYYCYTSRLDRMNLLEDIELIKEACQDINTMHSDFIPQIRREIVKQNEYKLCNEYKQLYWGKYPIVTIEEMEEFSEFEDAIYAINGEGLTVDNVQPYLDFINTTPRTDGDCYRVFRNLIDEDNLGCRETEVIQMIVEHLDYEKVQMMTMSEAHLDEVIEWLNVPLKLMDVDNLIDVMRRMRWLHPTYEDVIIKKKGTAEYVALINEINLYTDYTIEWISGLNPRFGLNTAITNRLFETGHYEHYVVGRVLFEEQFEYSIYEGLDEALKSLYDVDSPIFSYLSNSLPFMEKLMKDRDYEEFEKPIRVEMLKPLYKVSQTAYFMRFVLKNCAEDEILKYLGGLNVIKTQKDSVAIATLLQSNIKYLKDDALYNHVRYRLWENTERACGHKGALTKKRNEYLRELQG